MKSCWLKELKFTKNELPHCFLKILSKGSTSKFTEHLNFMRFVSLTYSSLQFCSVDWIPAQGKSQSDHVQVFGYYLVVFDADFEQVFFFLLTGSVLA